MPNNYVHIRLPIPREIAEQLHRHCSHAGIKRNALILKLVENHLRLPTSNADSQAQTQSSYDIDKNSRK